MSRTATPAPGENQGYKKIQTETLARQAILKWMELTREQTRKSRAIREISNKDPATLSENEKDAIHAEFTAISERVAKNPDYSKMFSELKTREKWSHTYLDVTHALIGGLGLDSTKLDYASATGGTPDLRAEPALAEDIFRIANMRTPGLSEPKPAQQTLWTIPLSKLALGKEAESETEIASGYAGISLSEKISAKGVSACTGLCIWDKKNKAALLIHLPKEFGITDMLDQSGEWSVKKALEHSMRFMLSKAAGEKTGDTNLSQYRKHMSENCTAMIFGARFEGLENPRESQGVFRNLKAISEFLGENGIRPAPNETLSALEVSMFKINPKDGMVEYRLPQERAKTASMR